MTRIPTHPGEILRDELDAREISMNQFAKALKVPTGRISQILAGKRSITPDTAIRLGHYLGTSAEVWMNLQTQYDLAVARQKLQNELKRAS
ncbi:MAG: HigA family addiction module antidote protein [Candidatus Omnitrophica bacterium]|nr:HigA family addiction module antidote protein [Candidatus Omnitrophota bacterium]